MHTVVLVLVQVLIIIGLSRLMGLGCRAFKQPLVIGEIIAGIMLGPSLFLGAAMSITAFPVLARIITENNLQGTRLGTLALTCAAVDDVTAWCLLALAIAVGKAAMSPAGNNNMIGVIVTLVAALLYIGFMVSVRRWFLKRLSNYYDRTGRLTQLVLAGIYMGVVASALITELIGIHLI